MLFNELAKYFQKIENNSSRLVMEEIVAEMLKKQTETEVAISVYLLNARLAPRFVKSEFNMAVKSVLESIKIVLTDINIDELYKELGDPGDLLMKLKDDRSKSLLSIEEVYDMLWEIANYEGSGSTTRKINKMASLLSKVGNVEGKYLCRLVSGKLRLGCSDRTIMFSISKHMNIMQSELNYAYGVCSDIGLVTMYALSDNLDLSDIEIQPGIPIQAQLVERATNFEEIIKRYPSVYVQPKFDGLRCQIHIYTSHRDKKVVEPIWKKHVASKVKSKKMFFTKKEKFVKLFSRNLEDLTGMFPDIVSELQASDINNKIFDSEVIGIKTSGEFTSFQDTIKRKRKHDIKKMADEIPVKALVFDIIYSDGESLIRNKLKNRIKKMKSERLNGLTLLDISETTLVCDIQTGRKMFEKYLEKGLEGIVAKNPNSEYQPGLRNFEWIKLKKSVNKHFFDTVDVVVVGFYKGRGKRAKYGLGALLTSIYDRESDTFLSIAKVGTGISDEQLQLIYKVLVKLKVKGSLSNVIIPKELNPDVLVYPKIVCVVDADEVTKSKRHTSGYSLRFPRLTVFDRKDKDPTDITSLEEVRRSIDA